MDLENANEENVQVKELLLKQQKRNEKLVSSKRALQKEMTKVKKEQFNSFNTINKQETLINQLNDQIDIHKKEILNLEQLQSLLESDSIVTFENGKYVSEVRETIMALVTQYNVSLTKVNDVIRIVMKNLADKQLGRLPSAGVKSGTSKYHSHYQGFQVSLKSGQTISLGMSEVGGCRYSYII